MTASVRITEPARSTIEPGREIDEAALALLARNRAQILATARRYDVTFEDAEDAYQRALEIPLTRAPTTTEQELFRWPPPVPVIVRLFNELDEESATMVERQGLSSQRSLPASVASPYNPSGDLTTHHLSQAYAEPGAKSTRVWCSNAPRRFQGAGHPVEMSLPLLIGQAKSAWTFPAVVGTQDPRTHPLLFSVLATPL
jgi:hypothetical protein